jgi:DNA-binding CsgD family transcriptional regulator
MNPDACPVVRLIESAIPGIGPARRYRLWDIYGGEMQKNGGEPEDSGHGIGLPQFLRFLGTLPAPDPVARALLLGPMSTFDAGAVSLTRVQEDALELHGTFGYTKGEVDGYWRVPLSVPTPFSRCVREAEVLIDEIEEVTTRFEALRVDEGLWQGFMDRFGIGQVISAPIVLQGTVIGAFGGITRSKREWSSLDFALLDGISSALGLWLTHPDTPSLRSDRLMSRGAGILHVTERQRRILRLVEVGKSNTAIGLALGYSVSTIKQELQRVMRAMGANDRQEAASRARSLGLLTDETD